MTTNRNSRAPRIIPNTRVVVVVNQQGKIIASEVVFYRGGRVSDYYKRISAIEEKLKEKSKEDDIRCYSGTASSVGNFIRIFPEVTSPF